LINQFQEVACWGADNLGHESKVKRREKDARGTSSVCNGIFTESMKHTIESVARVCMLVLSYNPVTKVESYQQ